MQNLIDPNPLFIEKVYERLLDAITSGDLKPGERVRQSVLADRLGVSRQPISHALQLLRHQGLVRDAGKQGVEVSPVNPDYIVHLYKARAPLEASAVAMAAQRVKDGIASKAEIDALKETIELGTDAVRHQAPLAMLVKNDSRFHMAIYRLSGNPAIEHMMAGQWPHLMRSMMAVLDDPGVPDRAWDEHKAMAAHIHAGNVDDAFRAATRHIDRAGSDLVRRLSIRASGA